MQEVSRTGTAGELRLDALIADPTRRAALGAAARLRAKEMFSAEQIVSHYVDFYRRTCSADTLRDGAGM